MTIETSFPAVPLTEPQRYHFEVYNQLSLLFQKAAQQIGKPCAFSFSLRQENGQNIHSFRIRSELADALDLPFYKLEDCCPWQIHAQVAKHLVPLIFSKKK